LRKWLMLALIPIAIGVFVIVDRWRAPNDILLSPPEVAAIYAPVINDLAGGSSASPLYVVKTTDDHEIFFSGDANSIAFSQTLQDEIAKVVAHPMVWVDRVEDVMDYSGTVKDSGVVYLGNT
jgi:hypothetical protein